VGSIGCSTPRTVSGLGTGVAGSCVNQTMGSLRRVTRTALQPRLATPVSGLASPDEWCLFGRLEQAVSFQVILTTGLRVLTT
jgi:hypothetical protein